MAGGYFGTRTEGEGEPVLIAPGEVITDPRRAYALGLTADARRIRDAEARCRVYWGTHGCELERGHDGPHICECAHDPQVDPQTRLYPDGTLNVGAAPYYGTDTSFYGEDA